MIDQLTNCIRESRELRGVYTPGTRYARLVGSLNLSTTDWRSTLSKLLLKGIRGRFKLRIHRASTDEGEWAVSIGCEEWLLTDLADEPFRSSPEPATYCEQTEADVQAAWEARS